MTVAGERDGARGSGRAQIAHALHGAGTPVLGPMDGAHERTTRQSCDELPVHFPDSVCGAAVPWRCFELTGQVTPIHSAALRRPGRARSGRASGVATGLPAHDVPVAGRELHATRGGRDGATGGGHRASGVTPRGCRSAAHAQVGAAAVAKPKDARAGVIEREDIWGRSVAPRLAEWGARPPARCRVATSVVADAHADWEPHAAAAGLS